LTPQSTTGATPAELLLNRRPRTRLDLLRPNTADRIERKQSKQKELHDTHSKERQFVVGDTVLVRNYAPGDKWLPGTVATRESEVHMEWILTVELLNVVMWNK